MSLKAEKVKSPHSVDVIHAPIHWSKEETLVLLGDLLDLLEFLEVNNNTIIG